MSHRGTWAIKDPNEEKDYCATWGADISEIAFGDALASSQWILPDGIQASTSNPPTFTATSATIWLSGGTAGAVYAITNRVTTVGGRTYDETFKLSCRNK